MPIHYEESDFEQNFPTSADVFPEPSDHEAFIDAILINKALGSIDAIEDYLLTWKANIEGAGGLNIVIDVATLATIEETPGTIDPPGLTLDSKTPAISTPTLV